MLVVVFALLRPFVTIKTGHNLFAVVSWCGIGICLLEGLRETVDSVSQERREGTLGLLFLTDLRGLDVISGKISAASIKAFSTLLAMLPAFALPIWMGGVTGGEFWRVAASCIVALIFSMAVGVCASAASETSFGSLVTSFLFLGFGLFMPAACLWFGSIPPFLAGPLGMFYFSADTRFAANPSAFLQAFLYSVAFSATLFLWSANLVSRLTTRTSSSETWWQKLLKPTRGYTETWAATSVHGDPAIWLAEHALPGRKALWILITLAAIICFLVGSLAGSKAIIVLVCVQVFVAFLIKIWMAALSVQPMHVAKRTGALELVLCTPLHPNQLLNGQLEVMRGYFFAPGIISSFGLMSVGVVANKIFSTHDQEFNTGLAAVSGVLCFISFLLDLNALGHMGLWYGVTETHSSRAVAQIVFRVLVLPWICLLIPIFGFFGLFVVPWLWMAWAKPRLNRRFREEAAKQSLHDDGRGGWLGLSEAKSQEL